LHEVEQELDIPHSVVEIDRTVQCEVERALNTADSVFKLTAMGNTPVPALQRTPDAAVTFNLDVKATFQRFKRKGLFKPKTF